MDFRLNLDYWEFSQANKDERKNMLFMLLSRSLHLLAEKGANPTGVAQLLADFEKVGKSDGWTE
jgi:hypothetical protein